MNSGRTSTSRTRRFSLASLMFFLAVPVNSFGAEQSDSQVWTADTDLERITEFLDLVASKTSSNVQQIQTWRGGYTFERRRLHNKLIGRQMEQISGGKPCWGMYEGIVTFAVDVPSKSTYMTYEPSSWKYVYVDTDEVIPTVRSDFSEYSVLTPEHLLTIHPDGNWPQIPGFPLANLRSGPIGYRRPPLAKRDFVSSPYRMIDPMSFFEEQHGKPLWELYSGLSTSLRNQCDQKKLRKFRLIKKTVEDDVIFDLEIEYNPGKKRDDGNTKQHLTFSFSESSNFSLVARRVRLNGFIYKERLFKYASQDGVRYPSEVINRRLNRDTKEEIFYQRFSIEECVFNQPFPDGAFTWKHISPENGTRIFDEIKNKLYTYQDGDLVVAK